MIENILPIIKIDKLFCYDPNNKDRYYGVMFDIKLVPEFKETYENSNDIEELKEKLISLFVKDSFN